VHVKIDPVPKGLDNGDDPGRKHAPGHSLEVTAQGPEGAAAEIAEPVLPLETVLMLSQEPVEMMEEYPVKDRALRMARAINSWHIGKAYSRSVPEAALGRSGG